MTISAGDTVVVGVDGTGDGERAIGYGVELAGREGLGLRLVHVAHEFELYAPMMPYLPAATVREIGESVLVEAAKHAEEMGMDAARTSTVLARGPRTQALVGQLEDARCLVLGTRQSTVQHLVTGATSLAAAVHSPVPVHCVPAAWTQADQTRADQTRVDQDRADQSGVDQSGQARVVAGVGGSDADAQVVEVAFAEAHSRGARLDIVHAWRPVSPYDAAIGGRVLREDWDRSTRAALTPRIDAAAATRPDVAWTLHLAYERVPVALHEAATGADLLVLGRHGHHGPLALLLGSNTRTLLHTATCPVVVVPTHPHQT
jgi:nucleotide-binding universal stress UspA family protein